ncbi:hypothetical protein KBD49_07960 [Myxococcota bacterium]|nr:hypothetical protein [Myxococcota bacterium]
MEDVSRFLRDHVPWSEVPSSVVDRVARGAEVLYLPRQSDLGPLIASGNGDLVVIRSGTIRVPSEVLPTSFDRIGEGDFLACDAPSQAPSRVAPVAEEDCLLYRIPAEVLASLDDAGPILPWTRWSPAERLARFPVLDPLPGRHPMNESSPEGTREPDRSGPPDRPSPAAEALARLLESLEEGPGPGHRASTPLFPLASLHPPAAALLHLWERLRAVASPEALGDWTRAALATLSGRRPGSLAEASRARLMACVADARVRKAADLAGRDRFPRCPWSLLTTAPADRCAFVPGIPLMLIARDATEADRVAARNALEEMDRILQASPVAGFPPPPLRSAARCLDESDASAVAGGSLDLVAEWLDARPVAGPLDPERFRGILADTLKAPENLRRCISQVRLRLPLGLFRGMVVRQDGRLEESITPEDLLFLPLRDLARIAAVLATDRSRTTPARWMEAARRGILPEEMARAAVGAWTLGLRLEIALGDPDVVPGEPSAIPRIRPRDLHPRDRGLARDALEVMHRLSGLLDRGPWSEGPWRY